MKKLVRTNIHNIMNEQQTIKRRRAEATHKLLQTLGRLKVLEKDWFYKRILR